jgi:hypothetical protein
MPTAHLPSSKNTVWFHSDARRTAKYLGLPMLAFLVTVLNAWRPVIRFRDEWLNVAVELAIYFMPFMTAIFALTIPRRWLTTILVIVLLIPLMLVSLFGLLLNAFTINDIFRTGVNPYFEPIAHVPMGGYSIGIYLTDCGAVCSFGIDILQEKQIVSGLLFVRRVEGFDPAIWPVYQVIGPGILRVDVPQYGNDAPARSHTYYLRPYLYLGQRPTSANQTDEHATKPVLVLEGASLIMPNRECANMVQRALSNDHMIPGIDTLCATVMAQALKLEDERYVGTSEHRSSPSG